MIEYVIGNIFESNADCLVNTVNCEGYMGKGIAYQFKLRYPLNNQDYVKACKSGNLRIGTIHSFKEDGVWIVNFPTKDRWREKSQLSFIEVGLDQLVMFVQKEHPKSMAVPPLGCGNGGLDWITVKDLIASKLESVSSECHIMVFEPSRNYKAVPKQAPIISASGLILLKLKMELKKVTALRFQKAAFLTNYFAGEDYFKFDKWKYGPYSHPVEIVAKSLGEYQSYYGIKDTQETYDHIYKVICSKKTEDTLNKILPAVKKAATFINSIPTNKKVEGVATVLFIVQSNEGKFNNEQIVEQFKQWSKDKANRFTNDAIRECVEYLEANNIICKNICGCYELTSSAWK